MMLARCTLLYCLLWCILQIQFNHLCYSRCVPIDCMSSLILETAFWDIFILHTREGVSNWCDFFKASLLIIFKFVSWHNYLSCLTFLWISFRHWKIVKLRSRSSPGPFLVHSRSIFSHSNLFNSKSDDLDQELMLYSLCHPLHLI